MNDNEAGFTVGENVILFLTDDKTHWNKDKSKDHFRTVGGYQGKWTVSDDTVSNKNITLPTTQLIQIIEYEKGKPKQINPHDLRSQT